DWRTRRRKQVIVRWMVDRLSHVARKAGFVAEIGVVAIQLGMIGERDRHRLVHPDPVVARIADRLAVCDLAGDRELVRSSRLERVEKRCVESGHERPPSSNANPCCATALTLRRCAAFRPSTDREAVLQGSAGAQPKSNSAAALLDAHLCTGDADAPDAGDTGSDCRRASAGNGGRTRARTWDPL